MKKIKMINLIWVCTVFTFFETSATNWQDMLEESISEAEFQDLNRLARQPDSFQIAKSRDNEKKIFVSIGFSQKKEGIMSFLKSKKRRQINLREKSVEIDENAYNLALKVQNSLFSSLGNLEDNEVVFTGYKEGGLAALFLALLYHEKYGETAYINQIKVLSFFSGRSGDEKFHNVAHQILGQKNILHFETYFQERANYGIPMTILPDEQMKDVLAKVLFNKKTLKKALILSVGSYLIFKTLFSFKDNVPEEVTGNVKSGVSTSKITPETISFSEWIAKHTYELLSSPAIILPFLSVYIKSYYDQSMPQCISEKTLFFAYKFTCRSYSIDYGESLSEIGKPSIFSFRRGIGSFFGHMFDF
jgi:hypothetical protein